MQLSGLDLFFWVAGLTGNVILLLVLWRKHQASHFPFFTTLVALGVVRTLALFLILRHGSKDEYFYTYWTLAIVDAALQFAILFQAASQIFRPMGKWAADVKRSFLWLTVAGTVFAVGLTWLATPETKSIRQVVVVKGGFFTSVLMSELFVGIVVLSVTSGLPMRTHVARIVHGWGVADLAGIIDGGLWSYFGFQRELDWFNRVAHLQASVYLLCLAYWIVTFLKDAPRPRPLPEKLHRQLRHLNQRVDVVLGHLRPGSQN
jgi:hypothetical protein